MQHEEIRYVGRFYVADREFYSLTVMISHAPFPEEMQRWYNSFRILEAEKQNTH